MTSPETTTISEIPFNNTHHNTTTCPDLITMDPTYIQLNEATAAIRKFYIWFIFAFGFPGNIFSVLVVIKLSRGRHSQTTSLFFVGLLAVVDNITIILKLIENQSQNQRFPMDATACKLLYFLGLTFANYANWILISLALERYLAVRFPLKVSIMWSMRKAVIVVILVFIFLSFVHFHLFWSVTEATDGFGCRLLLSPYQAKVWFYIGSILYAFLPACFLIPCNILIIQRLRMTSRKRKSLTESFNNGSELKKQGRQITAMLVTIAVVFVVLTFPRCVYIVAHRYWSTSSCTVSRALKIFLNVLTSNVADTNHAVNFYLYFLAGKRFRNAYNCRFKPQLSSFSRSNRSKNRLESSTV